MTADATVMHLTRLKPYALNVSMSASAIPSQYRPEKARLDIVFFCLDIVNKNTLIPGFPSV